MDLLACVDLPAFPLQLLLRQRPEWQGRPAAVVDEDKPLGLVLWVNAMARDLGVLPGARYGPSLSLAPELRAAPISEEAIQRGVRDVAACLRDFSPDVEPSVREPGIFWMDACGLRPLFDSPEAWARELRERLRAMGFGSGVAVGFRRFHTYAIARSLQGRKALVFESEGDEEAIAMGVPLSILSLPPRARDALAKLGVLRVGHMLSLPAHGLAKRFGPELYELRRFAGGDLELPLSPAPPEIRDEARLPLDYREDNAERLVFTIKPLVDRLLAELARRGRALTELHVELDREEAPPRLEALRLAEPTLASVAVMELVSLRLSATPFPAPVVGLRLEAMSIPASSDQLRLFAENRRRDPAAGARAFARLRATFGGEDVIVRAAARDRHSPEGSFAWVPLFDALPAPAPRPGVDPVLVRRLLTRPEPLPDRPRIELDGWLVRGTFCGPVVHQSPSTRLQGGWWRTEVDRTYRYVETQRGDLLWIYRDHRKNAWFLQGEIT